MANQNVVYDSEISQQFNQISNGQRKKSKIINQTLFENEEFKNLIKLTKKEKKRKQSKTSSSIVNSNNRECGDLTGDNGNNFVEKVKMEQSLQLLASERSNSMMGISENKENACIARSRQDNDHDIMEVLRQVVRTCTNPDTSKRPSAFEIHELLNSCL